MRHKLYMLRTPLTFWLGLCLLLVIARPTRAGGSGLNVVIIVNQNSTNSVQLGNYYRALRNVPPQNLLRINWAGGNTEWNGTDFTNTLLNPFLAMLSSRQLTNQIDYVVLSMDIPYRINAGSEYYNSTTSALFYGFVPDPGYEVGGSIQCDLASNSSNQYSGSECIFRQTPPLSTGSNFFLVTMITASNLATAKMTASQGASSDGTFPTQTVWLGKSQDYYRNIRYPEFDNTVFDTRLRGNYSVMRTNMGDANGALVYFPGLIMGYENGNYYYDCSPIPLFVPGAMADNLTSFSGTIFENFGQVTMIRFINAGVTGTYGTIYEPCNYPQKFPDSQTYFYQSRGFSLGECYYMSLTNPYQGLVVGEPLAAPFAQTGTGFWSDLSSNAVLSGITNLSGVFNASDVQHPLQEVDLFLDGIWLQTVTNIPPTQGNTVTAVVNGYTNHWTVGANENIRSVTSNLNRMFGGTVSLVQTKAVAYDHGDRIELQSGASYTNTGAQISVSVSSSTSSGPLTTFIHSAPAATNHFLDSTAQGILQCEFVSVSLPTNCTVTLNVTKTNGTVVSLTVTNSGATVLSTFAQQVVNTINSTASLQGADGLYGEDVEAATASQVYFNLQPQSGGYAAAQIKASFSASTGLAATPATATTLTQNSSDLEPREHLYITAGVSNLNFTARFVTTNQPDGYHELVAVAYEGSHVRTQTRATQEIVIRNTALSATLTPILIGSNSTLQPTLQINVTANTNNISSIQLFSTGGLLASATNQNSATFTIVLTNLNIGTHPFYAIVTQSTGRQYRTQTVNIGLTGVTYQGATLMGVDYSFPLLLTNSPPGRFTWPATAGRSYTILSTTNLLTPFQVRATVIPTNSLAQWAETNSTPKQQFYRVSVSP